LTPRHLGKMLSVNLQTDIRLSTGHLRYGDEEKT
jgi:hypothetical protein